MFDPGQADCVHLMVLVITSGSRCEDKQKQTNSNLVDICLTVPKVKGQKTNSQLVERTFKLADSQLAERTLG